MHAFAWSAALFLTLAATTAPAWDDATAQAARPTGEGCTATPYLLEERGSFGSPVGLGRMGPSDGSPAHSGPDKVGTGALDWTFSVSCLSVAYLGVQLDVYGYDGVDPESLPDFKLVDPDGNEHAGVIRGNGDPKMGVASSERIEFDMQTWGDLGASTGEWTLSMEYFTYAGQYNAKIRVDYW